MSLYVPSSDSENEMNREREIYNPPSPQYVPREENEVNGERNIRQRRQRRNAPRPRPRNAFPRVLQDGLGEMNQARQVRRRRRGVLDISTRLRVLLDTFRHACKYIKA